MRCLDFSGDVQCIVFRELRRLDSTHGFIADGDFASNDYFTGVDYIVHDRQHAHLWYPSGEVAPREMLTVSFPRGRVLTHPGIYCLMCV